MTGHQEKRHIARALIEGRIKDPRILDLGLAKMIDILNDKKCKGRLWIQAYRAILQTAQLNLATIVGLRMDDVIDLTTVDGDAGNDSIPPSEGELLATLREIENEISTRQLEARVLESDTVSDGQPVHTTSTSPDSKEVPRVL